MIWWQYDDDDDDHMMIMIIISIWEKKCRDLASQRIATPSQDNSAASTPAKKAFFFVVCTQSLWLILNPQRHSFSFFLVKINESIDVMECIWMLCLVQSPCLLHQTVQSAPNSSCYPPTYLLLVLFGETHWSWNHLPLWPNPDLNFHLSPLFPPNPI